MRRIIIGFQEEKKFETIALEIFGKYLRGDFKSFLSKLDDDHREIFVRSAHFLKFYVHDLGSSVPREEEYLKINYGFLGLTSLIEYCSANDPRFNKTPHKEARFIKYLKKGMGEDEKDLLIEKIEIYEEAAQSTKKQKTDIRLKLLYSFRSAFVHALSLIPLRSEKYDFLGHVFRLEIEGEKRKLCLVIKLSLDDYLSIVEKSILRNLGYEGI